MKELIAAIEALTNPFYMVNGREVHFNDCVDQKAVINLINTHMSGKVIVPVDDVKLIAKMFDNEDSIFSFEIPMHDVSNRAKAMLSTIGEQE